MKTGTVAMKTISFFVAGIPAGQPRARATAFGGHARLYTPKTINKDGFRREHPATSWKMCVRNEAEKAMREADQFEPLQGPLCVNLTFYFPRPKSHYKSRSAAARTADAPPILKPNAPKWHTTKPDRDNSDKACLDALTDLGVWHDDKQVCDGRIQKLYANKQAGCLIEICEAL